MTSTHPLRLVDRWRRRTGTYYRDPRSYWDARHRSRSRTRDATRREAHPRRGLWDRMVHEAATPAPVCRRRGVRLQRERGGPSAQQRAERSRVRELTRRRSNASAVRRRDVPRRVVPCRRRRAVGAGSCQSRILGGIPWSAGDPRLDRMLGWRAARAARPHSLRRPLLLAARHVDARDA